MIIIASLNPTAHWLAVIPIFLKVIASSLSSSARGKPKPRRHSLIMFVSAPVLSPVSFPIESLVFPCNHCCITADLTFSGSLAGNKIHRHPSLVNLRQIRQICRQIRQLKELV